MSWGIIGGSLIAAGASYYGAEQQEEALDEAQEIEAQRYAEEQALQADIYGDTEAFRELSAEAIPLIREDILAEPGTSELYQRTLTGGIEDIQSQLAGYGLADSSVSGTAIGEFTGELSAQDAENIRQARLGLLSGATTGVSETLGASPTSTDLSSLVTQEGEVTGGLYGDLANIATAGIGAYQEQSAYDDQLARQNEALYASSGGYGPYQYN